MARLAEAYFDTHRQQVAATPSQLANIVMVALVFFVQLHNHAVGCSQPLTLTKTGPGEAVLHMVRFEAPRGNPAKISRHL